MTSFTDEHADMNRQMSRAYRAANAKGKPGKGVEERDDMNAQIATVLGEANSKPEDTVSP